MLHCVRLDFSPCTVGYNNDLENLQEAPGLWILAAVILISLCMTNDRYINFKMVCSSKNFIMCGRALFGVVTRNSLNVLQVAAEHIAFDSCWTGDRCRTI